MKMAYTTNPKMPQVRAQAVNMYRTGRYTYREVARHFGFQPSTIYKWNKKAPNASRVLSLETRSSKPKSHPRKIDTHIVHQILGIRKVHNRCAEVIHAYALLEGINISLSSVKRILERNGKIKKKSPWKRYHPPQERPKVEKAGDLI